MKPLSSSILSRMQVGLLLAITAIACLNQLMLVLHDYLLQFRDGTNYELAFFSVLFVFAITGLYIVFSDGFKRKSSSNNLAEPISRQIDFQFIAFQFAEGFVSGLLLKKQKQVIKPTLGL